MNTCGMKEGVAILNNDGQTGIFSKPLFKKSQNMYFINNKSSSSKTKRDFPMNPTNG